MSLYDLSPEFWEGLSKKERGELVDAASDLLHNFQYSRSLLSAEKSREQRLSPLREKYGPLFEDSTTVEEFTDFSLQDELDNAYDGGFVNRESPLFPLFNPEVPQPLRRRADAIYIGTRDHQDRKRLFMETFGDQDLLVRFAEASESDPMNGLLDITEDPYRLSTWYNSAELNALDTQSDDEITRHRLRIKYFNMRYKAAVKPLVVPSSVTKPTLYATEWKTPQALFNDVLFHRDELVLKLTSLTERRALRSNGQTLYKSDAELAQIYNEIRIAYFLQELVYNYQHLLSVHFMTIVDWFIVPREKKDGTLELSKLYQCTVVERMDHTLRSHLKTPHLSHVTYAEFRCILFQIFNALEIAWITHRLVHYDMHDENIMLKRTSGALKDRSFVYRRYNDTEHWYVLDSEDMNGHYVKIIDLGRSRIDAPTDPADGDQLPHQHSQLIGPYEFESQGYGARLSANPYYDTRLFFCFLLYLPQKFWDALESSATAEEMRQLYDLFDRALDVDRLSQSHDQGDFDGPTLREYDKLVKKTGQTKLTTKEFHSTDQLPYWMLEDQNYARRTEAFGLTASGVLDHAFFAPLRRRFIASPSQHGDEESELMREKIDRENVIVSFPTNFAELNPHINPTVRAQEGDDAVRPHVSPIFSQQQQQQPSPPVKCLHNCVPPAEYKTVSAKTGDTTYFCGPVCYEFKYIFGGRTVEYSL